MILASNTAGNTTILYGFILIKGTTHNRNNSIFTCNCHDRIHSITRQRFAVQIQRQRLIDYNIFGPIFRKYNRHSSICYPNRRLQRIIRYISNFCCIGRLLFRHLTCLIIALTVFAALHLSFIHRGVITSIRARDVFTVKTCFPVFCHCADRQEREGHHQH